MDPGPSRMSLSYDAVFCNKPDCCLVMSFTLSDITVVLSVAMALALSKS